MGLKQNFNIETVANANVLIDSFKQSRKGTSWKPSVQHYEINLLSETYHTRQRLLSGEYKIYRGFVEFPLSERGKTRWIKSMHIRDRVVQRALCDYVLLPELTRYLIYDNGASVKDKGVDFALNRLYKHLNDHFVKTKSNKGYIVLFDFTKYFDNIPHEEAIAGLIRDIKDERLIKLIKYLISLFEIDLSILPKELQDEFRDGVFNNVKYSAYLHEHKLTANINSKNKIKKSAGVGSQISQIIGVYYPTPIDNYFKIVKGVHGYGRYMDDTYIIAETLEEAQSYLKDMYELCEKHHIHLNKKKTQIIKLSSWFTFLKTKHKLTKTGKIIRNSCHKNNVRERRKIKALTQKAIDKNYSFDIVTQSYYSYRGRIAKYNNYGTLQRMDALYKSLYEEYLQETTEKNEMRG